MSDILENFPTFSSKIFSDMPILTNRSDSASQGENQYLRDTLEKERYRRKVSYASDCVCVSVMSMYGLANELKI